MERSDFIKKYEHGKFVFYGPTGRNYKAYKCRNHIEVTPHKFTGVTGDMGEYECLICGQSKQVYVGSRKSPERSLM